MQLDRVQAHWSPATVLLCAYATALVALPSTLGIEMGVLVVTPARVLLVLGLMAAIAEVIRGRRLGVAPPGRWLVISWTGFLCLAAGSTAISTAGGGLSRFGSMVIEGAGVFWLAWWVARRAPRLVQGAIVAASSLVALIATLLAIIGLRYDTILSATSSVGQVRFGLVRQEASFDAPLFYAVWLVAAGALALGLALSARSKRQRWLALVAAAILAAGVVTTASRFGIAAVPAVVGLILMAVRRWRLGSAAIAIAVLVAIVPFGGTFGLDQGATLPLTSGPAASGSPATQEAVLQALALRGSTQARLEAISAAIKAVIARPILGWGPLSAKDVAAAELGHPNFVDDAYLVIVIELGIAGLAAFGLLIVGIFRRIVPYRSALTASQLVALISILAFGLVAATFATSQGYALFWLVAGLAVATADDESSADRTRREVLELPPTGPGDRALLGSFGTGS
jgi:hypothetical protein